MLLRNSFISNIQSQNLCSYLECNYRWVVIASSTLALRVFLFPLLIFQLHKLKRIGELFNKCEFFFFFWLFTSVNLTSSFMFFRNGNNLCASHSIGSPLVFWFNTVVLKRNAFLFFNCLFWFLFFCVVPPLFPSPFSGKSYIDQYSLFRKERKAIGCPSFLWFLPYVCVQVIILLNCVSDVSLW